MILSSASDAHGRRTKSNGAVRVSKSVGASGSRDGCLLRCSFGKRRCYWVETAYPWRRRWHWVQMIGWDPTRMVPVHPEQTGPGFTPTSPALRRSSRRCRAGWAAPVVEKGGCAPPIAQAGCVGPETRICVRRLHLLAGHHVKVPDRCLRPFTVVVVLLYSSFYIVINVFVLD